MHVYRRSTERGPDGHASHLYTVGFYNPDGVWNALKNCSSQKEAAEKVNYLNGGDVKTCGCDIQKSLLAACKELLIDAREGLEICGPCDHDVNICVCGLISNIQNAEDAIAKAEEDKPAKKV